MKVLKRLLSWLYSLSPLVLPAHHPFRRILLVPYIYDICTVFLQVRDMWRYKNLDSEKIQYENNDHMTKVFEHNLQGTQKSLFDRNRRAEHRGDPPFGSPPILLLRIIPYISKQGTLHMEGRFLCPHITQTTVPRPIPDYDLAISPTGRQFSTMMNLS